MQKTKRKRSKIGRPKKDAVRVQYQFRLLQEEHDAFSMEAERRGLPMTTWLRGLGRKAVGLDP